MGINLEPAQGAPAPSAGRLDRHDAEARQDRWMQELERALFSTSAKKQGGAPARQKGGAAAQDRAQAGGDAAERGGKVQATDEPSVETNMTGTGAGAQGAMAAPMPVDGQAPAGAQTLVSGVAAEGPVAAGTAAAIASGASASAAAVVGSGHSDSVQAVQAVQQVEAPLALGPSAEPLSAESTPGELGADTSESADSAFVTLADAAEFDKQLMHLFSGPDGMHAYIRDAELGAAQMRRVAAALSTEMALGGQALTTLTVNGKRITLAKTYTASPAFEGDGAASAAGDEPAGPRSHLQSLALVRKEPSK